MSRIADARRKSGVVVGADAELAWAEARAAMPDPNLQGGAVEQPLPWALPDQVGRGPTQESSAAAARHDRELVLRLADDVPAVRTGPHDEVSMLVRRLFAGSPVGAGIRTVMFCAADGAESAPVVGAVVARLTREQPAARIAVVRVGNVSARTAEPCAPAEVTVVSPVDAQRRAPEFAECFDFVLFEALLMGADPDVLALARTVEGVVLMIAQDATRRETARSLTGMLQDSEARVLGAVLCNCRYPIPKRVYERL